VKYQRSPEGEARRIAALRRPEVQARRSEKMKKWWENDEYRKKIINSRDRKNVSKETRDKLRVLELERRKDKDYADARYAATQTESFKKKCGDAVRRSWSNPEQRAKRIESLRKAFKRPEVLEKLSGEKNNFYRHGRGYVSYPKEFTPRLREEVRERDEYTCQMPGCLIHQEGRNFPVHHIDYDRNNNDKTNLITLCVKCHVETTLGDREYYTLLFKELQVLRGLGSAGI